jgi:predicted regulator of Ras-like GTPase activity (Roadblock/LC7/MglB family)
MKNRQSFLIGAVVAVAVAGLLTITPVGGTVRVPLPDMPRLSGSHAPTPPSFVNFQGVLTNPTTGAYVANGTYSVSFRIYDSAIGGAILWTETQSMPVSGGNFSVLLGSVNALPSDLFAGSTRYLEVQVGADPPMIPRQQFATVPYAFHSGTADSSDTSETATVAGVLARPGFSTVVVDSGGAPNANTSIVMGADGLPVVTYYDGANSDLKMVHCGNAACSSGNTFSIVDSAGDPRTSSVTVGADGLPLIAYHDGANTELRVAHCGDLRCSAGNTITTIDGAASDAGGYPSITIGRDGLAVVTYYDATNGDLKIVHCSSASCSSHTSTTVDSTGDVGHYTSVTVGADGLPIISYHDGTFADLKVAHCGNVTCTSGNIISTLEAGAPVAGLYTSIAIGVDGLPIIAFQDATAATVRVRHCNHIFCNTAGAGTSLGASFDTNSLSIGADGMPIIAHYEQNNADLGLWRCGSPDCVSSGDQFASVDGAGSVGTGTSVIVGADGLPTISYYDVTNGNLKVAHCSNKSCQPYHRPR